MYCNHVTVIFVTLKTRHPSHGSMHRDWPLGEVPEMEAVRELPRRHLCLDNLLDHYSCCLTLFNFGSVARELASWSAVVDGA